MHGLSQRVTATTSLPRAMEYAVPLGGTPREWRPSTNVYYMTLSQDYTTIESRKASRSMAIRRHSARAPNPRQTLSTSTCRASISQTNSANLRMLSPISAISENQSQEVSEMATCLTIQELTTNSLELNSSAFEDGSIGEKICEKSATYENTRRTVSVKYY